MLQYPVAMEIVALASAGIFTDFELRADAKFSVWSCVLSMTHFIWLWSRRKCIHNAAWTENSCCNVFSITKTANSTRCSSIQFDWDRTCIHIRRGMEEPRLSLLHYLHIHVQYCGKIISQFFSYVKASRLSSCSNPSFSLWTSFYCCTALFNTKLVISHL